MLKVIIICRDRSPLGPDIITLHTTYIHYYTMHYASLPNMARILLFSLPNISPVIRALLNSRENNDFTASVDQKVLQMGRCVVWGVGSQSVLLKPW